MSTSFTPLFTVHILHLWAEPGTLIVFMNFAIVSHLQAYWKNLSNERSTLFFNTTSQWFDKFFLIVCKFETIVKFVKINTVQPCLAISKVRAWWLSQVETWLIHQLLPCAATNGNVPAVQRFFVKQFYLGIILVGYLTYHVRQQFLESLC